MGNSKYRAICPHITRAFPPPGAEQVTWQCGGESEESGFFGGFLDGEEAGIEVHPGQTNGGRQLNFINMEGKYHQDTQDLILGGFM